ncbi:hypothetical protein Tco_1259157, partial [Tanacetum coccineum]
VKIDVQLKSDRLKDEAQAENKDFLNKLDANIKKIIKDQVKEQVKAQVSKILPKIEKTVNEQLEDEVMTRSSTESKTSLAIAANLSELELKKIIIEKMDSNKRRNDEDKTKNPLLDQTEGSREDKLEKNQSQPHPDWFQKPSKPPTPDRDWNKTLPAVHGPIQPWLSNLAREEGPRESFDELIDTPLDFSAFMTNRLKIDTLTPELLAGPTFELMKGTCKSLVELEYFFEEVYKATTDQLDWHNPKVIPFDHFINNDLAYLYGGVYSRTYATSITKTKAVDYGHIKWIEDLGQKRQQFYGFAANRESPHDVYSKRRIIAVTKLQIVEWHGYKHLDWITVRKLTNLNVEDRLAFGVSLRMFTRSIIIQRRIEDLQLAYSYPRGFIYLNIDKKNRLMRIDELHKFSDGTLDDVRTALNDRLKGIRMEYLPKTIWRQSDRERAKAMIQAIEKMLQSRRIMRSLEIFVGGRPYEGDFRLLQRTI